METKKSNNLLLKGSILAGTVLGMATAVPAGANGLFNNTFLGSGAEVRSELLRQNSPLSSALELKCGEKKTETKSTEQKCGEAKSKEQKCGEKKTQAPKAAKKTESKSKEQKCGEGKSKEQKCGESK